MTKGGMPTGIKRIWNIVSAAQHDRIKDAVLADIVDVIPIVGDFANAARVRDAVENYPERVVIIQTIDFLAGLLPIAGDIVDLLTPTNVISYLIEKKGVKYGRFPSA
jgi:hypothetical protein